MVILDAKVAHLAMHQVLPFRIEDSYLVTRKRLAHAAGTDLHLRGVAAEHVEFCLADAVQDGGSGQFIPGTEGHLEIVDSATRSLLINKRGTVSSQTAEAATSVAQPDAMAGLVEDFASAIQGNTTPVITAFDAIESHRWTLAARDDAESRT